MDSRLQEAVLARGRAMAEMLRTARREERARGLLWQLENRRKFHAWEIERFERAIVKLLEEQIAGKQPDRGGE